jgi:hypothetical protein
MNSTFHRTAPLPWRASRTPPHRFGTGTARQKAAKKKHVIHVKAKERRMPVISYREIVAAWALIVLVSAALFGSDFIWRDAATSCAQRIVAPQSRFPGTGSVYDHGERLDRLDWDKDINSAERPAPAPKPNPCPR